MLFCLIDMPGNGYAEAPNDIVRRWQGLVSDYLHGRAVLKRALLLIETHHGIKPVENENMDLLAKVAISYQILLTKADKIKPTAVQAERALVAARGQASGGFPQVLATSSKKGEGIAELRAAVIAAVKR